MQKHNGNLIRNHLGIIDNKKYGEKYHCGKLVKYHPKKASRFYHPGTLKWTHSQHIGGWTSISANMVVEGRNLREKLRNNDLHVSRRTFNRVVGVLASVLTPIEAPLGFGIAKVTNMCTYCGHKLNDPKYPGCMWLYDCCNNYETKKGCKKFEDGKMHYLCCHAIVDNDDDGIKR